MFINIHTHAEIHEAKVELVSLHVTEEPRPNLYSYGIHPWKIDKNPELLLESLYRLSKHHRCIAIGECGLDKAIQTDFKLQLKIFIEHVRLANQMNKPLIIHCVKAFNELIACLHNEKNKVPIIIHGYNTNMNTTLTLIEEGFVLSFGKALLSDGSNAEQALRHLSSKNIFLETDDADISIKYIYQKAAKILGISEAVLKAQIKNNYQRLFKEEIL